MGQQQLLLLVLATVIVGLATVAGIQAFEQGQTRANQDALTQTAVKIASDIQARIKEPSQFGGYDGDISSASGSISLEELGYSTVSSKNSDYFSTTAYEGADGECAMTSPSSPVSKPSSVGSTSIVVTCESDDNRVAAWVDGTTPDDIVSAAATLGT